MMNNKSDNETTSGNSISSSSKKELSPFPPKTRVILQGLVSKPEWNGKTGTIVNGKSKTKMAEEGRQAVFVHGVNQTVALKLENLVMDTTHTPNNTVDQTRDLKLRIKDLEQKVLQSQSKKRKDGSVKQYKATKTSLKTLRQHVEEGEECLRLLPELDDGLPEEQYAQVARMREMAGLPHDPPSEMKTIAWGVLKIARSTLAEALEQQDRYEEALPIYHALVEQCREMRSEIWESESELHVMMSNLGLCYKRCGQWDQAVQWYKDGLQAVEEEDPNSPAKELLESNLEVMTDWGKAGPTRQSGSSNCTKACWGCGKNPKSHPDIKLLQCSTCDEKKVATPAVYCSQQCQKKDWKRHKAYHKSLENDQETAQRNNYCGVEEKSRKAMEDPETMLTLSNYDSILAEAARVGMQGDNERETELLKRAILFDPANPLGYHNLSQAMWNSRNFEHAIQGYGYAMQLLEDKHERGEQLDLFEKQIWARSAASIYAGLTNFAECALIQKPNWMLDHDELVYAGRRAVAACPSFNETWAMLGCALEETDPEQAIQCYQQAASVSETDINRAKFIVKAADMDIKLASSARETS